MSGIIFVSASFFEEVSVNYLLIYTENMVGKTGTCASVLPNIGCGQYWVQYQFHSMLHRKANCRTFSLVTVFAFNLLVHLHVHSTMCLI